MVDRTLKKKRKKITDKHKLLMQKLTKEYLLKHEVRYFIGDTQVSKEEYNKHHVN